MRHSLVTGLAMIACLAEVGCGASTPNGPRVLSQKLSDYSPLQPANYYSYTDGQINSSIASNSTDAHHGLVEHGADDTVSWQLLFWAQAALAITSMSQPSFVNRYVYERVIFVTHASPFISIADALDLLIRILFAYTKLPLRPAITLARESFDTAPSQRPRKDNVRSILYTWLLFFLSVIGPGGKLFDLRGIPGNKSIASLYTISIIIRSLIDMVPEKAVRDTIEQLPVDEFGLTPRPDHLVKRKARVLEDNVNLLEFISWTLQGSALSATAGVILWIAIRSVRPLDKRIHMRTIHKGSIHHFRHWLHQLVLRLVYLVPTLFVIFLGCIVIFACLCGIILTTSVLALESLPLRKANKQRIALYSFALSWMLAAITFYVVMYNDEGTSKASVPEALG